MGIPLLETVLEIIDDVASGDDTNVFEFEAQNGFNYEALKRLVATQIMEHVIRTLSNKDMTGEQNLAILISSMSYMTMQNFVLEYKQLNANNN